MSCHQYRQSGEYECLISLSLALGVIVLTGGNIRLRGYEAMNSLHY